jgi:mutator protein MutT
MRKPEFHAAVFAIIKNQKWEVLFSRRYNTWHLDWYLSLPAWHIENWETASVAIKRELREEIGIEIIESRMIFSQQSKHIQDWITYFNFLFEILSYSWEISNQEPEKCSELRFAHLSDLKNKEPIVPYVKNALENIENNSIFSEISWQ